MNMLSHMLQKHLTLTNASDSFRYFAKNMYKNDSQVASLEATKMQDHSHTIWGETKAKIGCPLFKVMVLNEHVVDETCDCKSCKYKKITLVS